MVFRFGLWPAALALWGVAPHDPRAERWTRPIGRARRCCFSGLPPLPLKALAAKAHEQGGVTGAMAHAFSRWAWAEATFALPEGECSAEIDALAVRRGSGRYQRLDRKAVAFPPADYNRIGTAFASMCGTSVRIEIDARDRPSADRQGVQRA